MFLCLMSRDGRHLDELDREIYASRFRALSQGLVVEVEAEGFAAYVAPWRVPLRPLYARCNGLVGVGNVRLDNSDEVRSWGEAAVRSDSGSDLALVLEAFHAQGLGCIRNLLGDFAFVIWEVRTRRLVAARDAFGVRTLFSGVRRRELVLSSHLELVHNEEKLDEEYVADFLLGGDPGPERTIWADSRAVPQGSTLTASDHKVALERFWTPYAFEPVEVGDKKEHVEHFRELFRQAVRLRLAPNELTWAELSGGLDSSSVVCMAQTLVEEGAVSEGIAGTISVVDELGCGNETRFSDAVVRQFELRNEIISNPWPWQDDDLGPERNDEPRVHYPYFARDRLECAIVRGAGGRVLLSGMGADHYLYGNRLLFSDLFAQGHVLRSFKELVIWCVAEKQSLWKCIARDLVLPLVPTSVHIQLAPPHERVPAWITPTFASRCEMGGRLALARTHVARPGSRFAREVANELQELTRWLQRGPFEDCMELRYPFLSRPLVEFGLQLPMAMRSQPLAPKWVVREAMRGILPERVRTRPGKGGIGSRVLWAMWKERRRVQEIVQRPVLSDLGLIRADRLDKALEAAWHGRAPNLVMLFAVLSLETWLFVRSGRWGASGFRKPLGACAPPSGREVRGQGGEK